MRTYRAVVSLQTKGDILERDRILSELRAVVSLQTKGDILLASP